MMSPTNEFPPTLGSVESIKAYLAGVVQTAADNRGGTPVLLTFVGGEFAKAAGTTFEKHLTALADQDQISVPKGRRKLVPFVQTYCDDILATEQTPAGSYLVSPRRSNENLADHSHTKTASALRFHRAVWAAFIRPLDGKRRFLNLDQIGFTDSLQPPGEGNWKEIDQGFVLGAAPQAAIDGAELQARIEKWAREADVAISKLTVSAPPSREPSGHLSQLLDIIEALPPQLANQWSIPAAVLKHLRGAR